MTMFNMPKIRGRLLFNESLSRYNTWGVGGNAECLYHPADIEDLSLFLSNLDQAIPLTWLGLGSNVLVRDGGVAGVVIATQSGLKGIQFSDASVQAEAGLACAKLARAAVAKNLSGIEFMAGIPGTVGGALAMNAGAFGGQTWENIVSVEVINRQGKVFSRQANEYEYGYRYVNSFKNEWFVSACFNLKEHNNSENVISIKELLKQRAASQPIGKKNCGSVFKNPENYYAASLIESCGLKGFSVGGASVSAKHANFIINEHQATATDIEKLIQYVQEKVKDKHNIELVPEVKILGHKEKE